MQVSFLILTYTGAASLNEWEDNTHTAQTNENSKKTIDHFVLGTFCTLSFILTPALHSFTMPR